MPEEKSTFKNTVKYEVSGRKWRFAEAKRQKSKVAFRRGEARFFS